MKKILYIFPFLFLGCVNPSMERGFESLNISLLGVTEDLNNYATEIHSLMDQIENDIELIIIEIDRIEQKTKESLLLIQSILEGLARAQEQLDKAATREQMQALLEDINEFGEGIRVLWNLADFDADGVINGLDQCPETPFGLIVNERGCAEGQTPISETESSTLEI